MHCAPPFKLGKVCCLTKSRFCLSVQLFGRYYFPAFAVYKIGVDVFISVANAYIVIAPVVVYKPYVNFPAEDIVLCKPFK